LDRFAKYHGLGNHFVIVDARADGALMSPDRARQICDVHRGVGADGVLTVLPGDEGADARMHLFNADGSEAEMCGNGLRCVVAFLGEVGDHLLVDTGAGRLEGWVLDEGHVRVTLGPPAVGPPLAVEVDGTTYRGQVVSMGNPHFVLEPIRGDADLIELAERCGPGLESAPEFPDRTNVELIARRGDTLEVVVFERGVGITQACGTGAGAAAVAALRWGLADATNPIRVQLPGGVLDVSVDLDEAGAPTMVSIAGEALHVFDGTWA